MVSEQHYQIMYKRVVKYLNGKATEVAQEYLQVCPHLFDFGEQLLNDFYAQNPLPQHMKKISAVQLAPPDQQDEVVQDEKKNAAQHFGKKRSGKK